MSTIKLNADLLPSGGHVLCAISGGADSVCLLLLLRERTDIRLSAAHYNHCLRGEESDGDEAFVRALCADWGIPLYCGSGDVAAWAKERGISLETAAREKRYEFLYNTAAAIGADRIATAHNANDNAETLLLRMARGTTLKGLCGIPGERDRLIRPLLAVDRQEIEAYLAERGIPHREDSSNALDEAARNRIRHYAVPALQSVNSGAIRAMNRLVTELERDEDYLNLQAREACERLTQGEALSVSGLRSLHPALRGRVIRLFTGSNLPLAQLTAVLRLCEGGENGEVMLGNLTLRRSYDRLLRGKAERPALPDTALIPGECTIWGDFRVRTELLDENAGIQNSFNTFSFSYGRICGTLFLTPRREGDTILFSHRKGTRKLHRLMIDAKIPEPERAAIPVVRDEEGVLAVYGFGRSVRAMPERGERVLRIIIEKTGKETERK